MSQLSDSTRNDADNDAFEYFSCGNSSSTHRVCLTRRWPESVERHLAARYQVATVTGDSPLHAKELAEAFRSYDAVCPTVSDSIPGSLLSGNGRRLKILANYGVGVNHIDLGECRRLGIVVTNTPDVLTECTADLAITLMLMVARRAGEGERLVRSGGWSGWSPTHMWGRRVAGKTLGLIGFGRIGQATARRASKGFGMRILYHARKPASAAVEFDTDATYCEALESLLARADFVSLHCPGGAETRHLLDAHRLSLMNSSAFLINTSRGDIVNESALADALRRGVIAGAALDVHEFEPRVSAELCAMQNVVLLPHLGSATVESRVAMGMRVAENLDQFFSGREPRDRVV